MDEVKRQKLVEIDESSDILGAVIVLEIKDEKRESSGHLSTQMYLYIVKQVSYLHWEFCYK